MASARQNTYRAEAVLNNDTEVLLGFADSFGAAGDHAAERLADMTDAEFKQVGVVRFSRWHGVPDAGLWKFMGQRPASNFMPAILKIKAERARRDNLDDVDLIEGDE